MNLPSIATSRFDLQPILFLCDKAPWLVLEEVEVSEAAAREVAGEAEAEAEAEVAAEVGVEAEVEVEAASSVNGAQRGDSTVLD